jgi:uncharacterized protein (TIGR03086 family)
VASTTRIDKATLAGILGRQMDVITRGQALAAGVTDGALRHRLRPGGPWRTLLPTVYIAATGMPSRVQQQMAAQLYGGPGSVVTGSAAVLSHRIRAPESQLMHATSLAVAFVQEHPARPGYGEGMNTDPRKPANDGPALMAAAAAETARVVSGAASTALEGATPCTDWDLRTLLNHTILWTSYSAERRAHGESVDEELMSKDFTADPGFAQDYETQIAKAVQAWSDPSAWAGDRSVMGSATPAADIAAMLIMEMVLHGWDIAKATGQEYRADDQLAAAVLETVQAQAELFRQYHGFADAIAIPDDATAFDRALSLSGRDPSWKR